jgi:uncharacterized protein (DUF362 family)
VKPCLLRRALTAAFAGGLASCQKKGQAVFAGTSPVAVLRAKSYQDDLAATILEGIKLCGLVVKDKRILLKPNLVEFDSATAINTDVALVAAALEAFRSLGAASVTIAEGPGHRRDTMGLADQAGYWKGIRNFEDQFVDLNRDDVSPVKNFATERQFFLPNTALGADLIVSMPKMKTHHWAGATLSMKNFFGLVPGAVYGWPKNTLHYIGIDDSIVALNRQFRRTFAIVDGIVGMEGNGPIQGTAKNVGLLVFGQDLVAVDSTCCRIMGIDPAKIGYLRMAADLGAVDAGQIQQRGENPLAVRTDFELIQEFASYRLDAVGRPG